MAGGRWLVTESRRSDKPTPAWLLPKGDKALWGPDRKTESLLLVLVMIQPAFVLGLKAIFMYRQTRLVPVCD